MLLSSSHPIWSLPVEGVYDALGSHPTGLSNEEAEDRLRRFGANRLPEAPRTPLWRRFADQLVHFMALLLWVAGAMAFLAGTPELGWAIWSVVVINAVFSFWQEFQAERTLAALLRVLPRQCRVMRAGQWVSLPVDQLVPGDLLQLEEGEQVPADCRLIRSAALYLDVSVLTGESLPVARAEDPVQPRRLQALRSGRIVPRPGEHPLQERLRPQELANLLPAGATVASGHGDAMVYATGGETEFGQVARLTAGTRRSTSTLERHVRRIVRLVTLIALLTGGLSFLVSLVVVGLGTLGSLVFAIGIIVALVPEGLLPTVTLSLALAVRRMARRHALVRRLSAVETLGAVSVICTDKTGTLTCNRMALEAVWLPRCGESPEPLRPLLLLGAALCSNVHLGAAGPEGDPTEAALLQAALQAGLDPDAFARRRPRSRELPFDSHRRMMTVVLEWNDDEAWFEPARRLALTKGAPHEVLRHCRWIAVGRGRQPLDEDRWREVVAANDELAGGGCRVLALAVRPGEGDLLGMGAQDLERELVFVGLLALYDPPRPGVEQAIAQCRSAGIKVTMVTGDYGLTAQSIARQIGLLTVPTHGGRGLDPVRVINGSSLDHLSDAQLRQLVKYRSRLVFARMAPEQKLRLVQAYRDLGEVVAVTGDGVNDAPALRMAHAGVAMGLAGTDVAREAADIVLLDDDFTTIVSAVRYGRSVYANIRKFLTYVLVSNVAEVMPFLAMATLQLPAALTVLQILAVDLGTDLIPALALGAERPEPQVMAMPPHRPGEPLMNRFLVLRAYLFLGLIEGILAIAGYLLAWQVQGVGWHELRALAPRILHQSATPEVMALQRQASAVAFAAIVSGQIGCVVACRSERRPSLSLPPFENSLLWLGIAIEVLVLAALLYVPPLAALFQMEPFPAPLWLWVLLCGPLLLLADEGRKAWAGRGAAGLRRDGGLEERPS